MDLPSDSAVRWLVRRYATLLARDGQARSTRKVILPTAEFFPDSFDNDPGSVNVLFWRLQEHALLTDLEVELRFINDAQQGAGGCGSGGCSPGACTPGQPVRKALAPIHALPDGAYRVDVRLSDARTPLTLTASLASSLAHLFVLETGGFDGWPESEWMASCELAAALLGFGVLMTNAAYIYGKGCHGASITQATALTVSEQALALALFVALQETPGRRHLDHLGLTQREAFGEAQLWVDSNAKLIKRLKRDPGAVVADEHLSPEPARPWLARVLGLGRKKAEVFDEEGLAELESSLATKRAASSLEKAKVDPRLAELRSLVDESLAEMRSSQQDD